MTIFATEVNLEDSCPLSLRSELMRRISCPLSRRLEGRRYGTNAPIRRLEGTAELCMPDSLSSEGDSDRTWPWRRSWDGIWVAKYRSSSSSKPKPTIPASSCWILSGAIPTVRVDTKDYKTWICELLSPRNQDPASSDGRIHTRVPRGSSPHCQSSS